MTDQNRKEALRRYLVFRVKAIEFLDIAALHQALRKSQLNLPNPANRKPSDFADALRTVGLSWFALFVDKNGMNIITLWKELFPQRKAEIEAAWKKMEPAWEHIRTFRNRAGFHADKPVRFFEARHRASSNNSIIGAALLEFQKLMSAFLRAEETELPEFGKVVEEFLEELENKPGYGKYNRAELTRYLMLGHVPRK